MRGDVHHQPQTRQRGTAVEPADQIRRQGDGLKSDRQRQFTRVQVKRVAVGQHDFITHHTIERGADFIFRPAEVDKGRGMSAEGTKLIPQTHINSDAVNPLDRRARGDGQTAFVQPGFNISVT
ncbi:hypothetical protein D3C76_1532700 [compost metagenome]